MKIGKTSFVWKIFMIKELLYGKQAQTLKQIQQ